MVCFGARSESTVSDAVVERVRQGRTTHMLRIALHAILLLDNHDIVSLGVSISACMRKQNCVDAMNKWLRNYEKQRWKIRERCVYQARPEICGCDESRTTWKTFTSTHTQTKNGKDEEGVEEDARFAYICTIVLCACAPRTQNMYAMLAVDVLFPILSFSILKICIVQRVCKEGTERENKKHSQR